MSPASRCRLFVWRAEGEATTASTFRGRPTLGRMLGGVPRSRAGARSGRRATVVRMDLPAVVCRYAEPFAALGGGDHHVASPLGAWLVLALAAPAATGELAEQITDALGADAQTAHRAAADLLARPHPVVSAAAAAWTDPGLTGLDGWRDTLPTTVSTGPVPTQAQADAWAREHTLGQIETFPLDLTRMVIVLASALATKVTWVTPFELADAGELRGPWSGQLSRVLRAPRGRAPGGSGHRRSSPTQRGPGGSLCIPRSPTTSRSPR